MKRLALALILLGAAAAGCMSEPPAIASHEATETSTTQTQTEIPPLNQTNTGNQPEETPSRLLFSDCYGVRTRYDGLRALHPTSSLPAWEQEDGESFLSVLMTVMSCDRVMFGRFERPSFVFIEDWGSASPPESCKEGANGEYAILLSIWLSDAELTAAMKDAGLPASLGVFNITLENRNGVVTQTWSWGPPGQDFSWLSMANPPPEALTHWSDAAREYWLTPSGMSYLDLEGELVDDQAAILAAVGVVNPPMIYASGGVTAYAAKGQTYSSMEFSIAISRFGDESCEQPLSS